MLLETPIRELHEKFDILAIQKLTFHLQHLHILGTYQCGKEWNDEFKHREMYMIFYDVVIM